MSELTNWNTLLNSRYAEALARGLHDDDCEQRERYGLCGCSERKRVAEGRTKPPTLIINYPTCSGCWDDVYHDGDGFRCDTCCAVWSSNAGEDEPATFYDQNGDLSDSTEEQFGRRLIDLLT